VDHSSVALGTKHLVHNITGKGNKEIIQSAVKKTEIQTGVNRPLLNEWKRTDTQ